MNIPTVILWMPGVTEWYNGLMQEQRDAVDFSLAMLAARGAYLGMPHAKKVTDAKEPIIELRPSSRKHAIRVFYAFNPRREAVLLVGANKKGVADEGPWTAKLAERAGRLWDAYLRANGWRR